MNSKKGSFFFLFMCLAGSCLSQASLSLKDALQSAKTNSLMLKTAHYNIGIAETDIQTAQLRPNLNLNNQTLQSVNTKYHAAGSDYFSPVNRQVWWQLTKPIRLAGQRRNGIDLAQQGVIVEQNNYLEVERNLALDVSNQWLDTWILKTRLDLYLDAQKNIDSLVKISQLRLKNLVITQTDLIRTQLIAEQYRLQIRLVNQSYKNELKKLKMLLNRQDSISIEPNDAVEPLVVQGMPVDTLVQMGFNNRADVLSAKSFIGATNSNIKYQKSLAYPVPELGVIWNPQNTIPYLGFFGTIQVPIFARNQGQIAKSELVRQQAQQGLEALQQRINTEVVTAYQSYRTQKENLARYDTILVQSEKVLSSVRYAYLKGGTTIIDFLEAQRSWFDTRQLYYDAVISYRKSYIQLLFSTGLINQLYE